MIGMQPPMEQRKAVDQRHAAQRAEKRRQRDPGDFTEQPAGDGQKPIGEKNQSQNSAQGSAARHTEHLRTSERIAEQSLQHHAAGRHPAADGDAQEHPRQTRAKKYFRVRIRER